MAKRLKTVTIDHVAEAAGLSRSTVSIILNYSEEKSTNIEE